MHSHVSGLFNYLGHKMYELLRENSSIFFYQPPFLVYFQEVDMKLLWFKLSSFNAVKNVLICSLFSFVALYLCRQLCCRTHMSSAHYCRLSTNSNSCIPMHMTCLRFYNDVG